MHALRISLSLGVALAPAAGWANAFDVFGAGARNQGMAGAVSAAVGDYTAVWHNPAALAAAEDSIGVGLLGSFDRTAVLLYPRPAGYDPPGYGERLHPRADTDALRANAALTAGLTFPLFIEDLRVGAMVLAPFDGFGHVSTHFNDEREQYFSNQLHHELLGERLQSEVIAGALAYRVGSWLSLGIGLTVLPANRTDAQVLTPNPADPATVEANTRVEQTTTQALTLGVLVEPTDWLRLAGGFHDEDAFHLRIRSHVQIAGQENEDGEPFVQAIDHVVHYSPPRFRLGGAVLLGDMTATVEGTYRAWSRYRDSHGDNPGFADTIDVAGGIEYAPTPDTFLRAGAGWHPSPVPPQTGRTNYVDNDRVVLALGGGRRFGASWMVDFGVQIHALIEAHVRKERPRGGFEACAPEVTSVCDEVPDRDEDRPGLPARATRGLQTGNPGFPGYVHGGYLVSTSLDVKYLF